MDPIGNIYVSGYTGSSDGSFPATVGPDLSHNGHEDVFVAKVSFVSLTASSSTVSPGGHVTLTFTALDDKGLTYQAGSSFGRGVGSGESPSTACSSCPVACCGFRIRC